MIWEQYQQEKKPSADKRAADKGAEIAEWEAEKYSSSTDGVQASVNRLSLACQAMWELLRENSDLTESDLENKINDVDLRDGKADGKICIRVVTCSSCGKNTNSKRNTCIMCGAPIRKAHQFEA